MATDPQKTIDRMKKEFSAQVLRAERLEEKLKGTQSLLSETLAELQDSLNALDRATVEKKKAYEQCERMRRLWLNSARAWSSAQKVLRDALIGTEHDKLGTTIYGGKL